MALWHVVYGVVPDGADLSDGEIYAASAYLAAGSPEGIGCTKWSYVWRQGDPTSVIQCE